MKSMLTIASLMLLTGCASITGSKMQPVSLQTTHDNKELAGANCTLVNDAGKWFVTTPGSVTIQKSTGDLAVNCTKDGGFAGQENIASKANGGVWGNILAGGVVGYVVDRQTGAGFDYPSVITVTLRKLMDAPAAPGAAPAPEAAGGK